MRPAGPATFGQLPVVLALCGAMLTSLLVGPGVDGLLGALLSAIVIAIALVDARRYIIPNELTAAVLLLALLRAGMIPSDAESHAVTAALLRAVLVTVLFFLLSISYRYFRGREGFGLGDVKLLGAAAAWLDWPPFLIALEGATLVALTTYLVRQWAYNQPAKATAVLPFGTFLAPFIWIGWLIDVRLN
jgi:leader peptidase (prepilin peptidase) / N-methyltransferase